MRDDASIGIVCCGYVLQEGCGLAVQAEELPAALAAPAFSTPGDHSVKGRLKRVKGYLDPAARYLLGAAALLPEDSFPAETGVSVVTRYGATRSAWTFYEQMQTKGPRLASPMIFPHGYVNTAANLLAIEHAAAGPHMVFGGPQAVREVWEFAVQRLRHGDAPAMLLGAYEAAEKDLLPTEAAFVRNGALCALLKPLADCAGTPLAAFQPDALSRLDRLPDSGLGQVEDLLRSLRLLSGCGNAP